MFRSKISSNITLTLLFLLFGGQLAVDLFAADIEIRLGDRELKYNIVRDEIAYRPLTNQQSGVRVENINSGFRRLNQSYAKLSQQGAMPVLYPEGAERSESLRRFGTSTIIIETNGNEPDIGWFQPAPLQITTLTIPGLALDGFWAATFESPWAALQAFSNFEAHSKVETIYPDLGKTAQRRLIPNDPRFGEQYQLHNIHPTLIDLDISGVWDTYRGAGSIIGIVDNGINYAHNDLNIRTDIDVNYNGGDPNNGSSSGFTHGTGVAGIAAARGNNGIGVAGVAFEAQVVSLKLTAGIQTDSSEASSFTHQSNVIPVKNYSWGPTDDGFTLEGPGPLGKAALAQSTLSGRNGLGSIHVWAAGNGGLNDDINKDGYASSIYTIALGALNVDGSHASFSEPGTSLVCTVPVANGILSTNGTNGYYVTGGTSAAAPVGAGVIALMLQANPQLSWRDVQDILIRSSVKIQAGNAGWITNAAGLHFNRLFGAGKVDAQAAINLSLNPSRQSLGAHTSIKRTKSNLNQVLFDGSPSGNSFTFNVSANNFKTEHVTLKTNISHSNRGDIEISIISPSGTKSTLINKHNDTNDHYSQWEFMSVFYWGENPNGTWNVIIRDTTGGHVGVVQDLELSVYGSGTSNNNPDPDPITTNINIPNQVASFNGGQQSLNLLPYTGLSSASQIKSITIKQNSNPALLQRAEIQGTSIVFQPAVGASGNTSVQIETKDQSDNLYIGSFQISVPAPNTIQVTLPSRSFNQDSGQHSINLLPFSNITNISQLSSISLSGNTNPGLLPGVAINGGYLNFSTGTGQHGETTVSFVAQATNGQPYAGSIKITVNQVSGVAFIPHQTINENSGVHSVNIYSYLQLSSPSELVSLTLTGNTYPSLLKRAEMSNGQFIFEPDTNKIGVTAISFAATTSQKSFTGSFGVTVNPITRVLNIPDQEVFVNASQQSLNLIPFMGLASIHELKSHQIVFQSNPSLLAAVLLQTGQLIWHPATGRVGENLVTIQAEDIFGRNYEGVVRLIVEQQRLEALIPNQQVAENSGSQSVNILPFFTLNFASELSDFSLTSQSNPSLFTSWSQQGGSFNYTPAPNQFGTNVIAYEAQSVYGIIYYGQFAVVVTPIEKVVNVPSQGVLAGAALESVNLLPYFGFGSSNQISSFTIDNSTNPGLLSISTYDNGFYRFQPASGAVGSAVISFSANGSDGRPYSGSIPVVVTPNNLQVSIPNISSSENSGQQAINLASLIAQSDSSSIGSVVIDQNTNPLLVPSLNYNSGTGNLEVNIGSNQFGESQISISGSLASNRTFSSSFTVVIQPVSKNVLPPNITLVENSGDHSVRIIDHLGLSSPSQLAQMNLTNVANGSLFSNIFLDQGVLYFTLQTDTFGATPLTFTAIGTDGRPYHGSFAITITPESQELIIPNEFVQENTGPHQINLLTLLGVSQVSEVVEVSIIGNSNPGLIQTVGYDSSTGLIQFELSQNAFGESSISLTGKLSSGRPFSSTFEVTVIPQTREMTLSPVVVPENSSQQSFNLVAGFNLGSLANLNSPQISAQTSPALFTSLTIENENLLFIPAENKFGQNTVTISVVDGLGRPYIGELDISITPLAKNVFVPDQVVAENSGSHSLSLAQFISLDAGTQLASMQLGNVSNTSLFSNIEILNGVLQYSLQANSFGTTSLAFTAQSTNGRPYAGQLAVSVIPNEKTVIVPNQIVTENSGAQSLQLSDYFILDGGSDLAEVLLKDASNPSLFSSIQLTDGILNYTPSLNTFGSSSISFSALATNGRSYQGAFEISVTPNSEDIIFPNVLVNENSDPQQINLLLALDVDNTSEIAEVLITGNTNPSLINSIEYLSDLGRVEFTLAPDSFGDGLIIVSGKLQSGRPFSARITVKVIPNIKEVDFPPLIISENADTQIINLIEAFGINPSDGIQSPQISLQTNPGLSESVQIENGNLIIVPKINSFGINNLTITTLDTRGRPYIGDLRIVIEPDVRFVSIPPQTIVEEGGVRTFDLVPYFPFDEGESLDEIQIDKISNQSLIESADLNGGIINYQLVSNILGESTIEFSALSNTGRPYKGELVLIVSVRVENIEIDDQIVAENTPQKIIDIVPYLNLGSPPDIIRFEIISQSNGGLLSGYEINGGSITIFPAQDKFGENTISFQMRVAGGIRYDGNVKIVVDPIIDSVLFEEILLRSNPTPADINIVEHSKIPNLHSFELEPPFSNDLLSSVQLEGEILKVIPKLSRVGRQVINLSASDSEGRPYRIQLPIILDSYAYWNSENFSPEELNNPDLELSLWGREADPDKDGWDNYSEYVFGGKPLIRELKLNWISVSIQKVGNDRFQVLKLRTRTDDEKLIISPQLSYNKTDWTNVPLAGDSAMELLQAIDESDYFTTYTLRSLTPLAVNRPEYLRVLFDRID